MHRIFPLSLIILCLFDAAIVRAAPRNIILIIGDGFDDQHVTMGRNYLAGISGQLGLDTMPFRAAIQIETIDDDGQP
ncbi:MAG: alkaline phosphatase, partial [Halieaceae bacterium]